MEVAGETPAEMSRGVRMRVRDRGEIAARSRRASCNAMPAGLFATSAPSTKLRLGDAPASAALTAAAAGAALAHALA